MKLKTGRTCCYDCPCRHSQYSVLFVPLGSILNSPCSSWNQTLCGAANHAAGTPSVCDLLGLEEAGIVSVSNPTALVCHRVNHL